MNDHRMGIVMSPLSFAGFDSYAYSFREERGKGVSCHRDYCQVQDSLKH